MFLPSYTEIDTLTTQPSARPARRPWPRRCSAFQGGSGTVSHQQSRQAAAMRKQTQVSIQLKDRILGRR